MNPLCPNCQSELTDDFGLVDCKSCGAVCSIDLEDNVTVQGDEAEVAEELEAEEFLEVEPEEESIDENDDATAEPLEVAEELVESYGEQEVDDGEEEDIGVYEEEPASEEMYVATPATSSLSGEDFLKDLEIFSEESATDGGHIYYDFHVAGLEDASLRENFIETLADSRLEISEEAIREILGDSSEFTLPQISFLRLTVIYKRLLTLGLDMSWSLSEVQEPVSYMAEEVEEPEAYEDEGVVYEEAEEEY